MKCTPCMNFWPSLPLYLTALHFHKRRKLEASHVSQTQQQTPLLLNATKKPPPSPNWGNRKVVGFSYFKLDPSQQVGWVFARRTKIVCTKCSGIFVKFTFLISCFAKWTFRVLPLTREVVCPHCQLLSCQLHIAKSSTPLGQSYIAHFPSSPHFCFADLNALQTAQNVFFLVDCPSSKVLLLHHPKHLFLFF
jgi:hypothetical protein